MKMGTVYTTTLCRDSPTGKHFHQLPGDMPRDVRTLSRLRVTCEQCGRTCKLEGALWTEEHFILAEEEHIEDLLG